MVGYEDKGEVVHLATAYSATPTGPFTALVVSYGVYSYLRRRKYKNPDMYDVYDALKRGQRTCNGKAYEADELPSRISVFIKSPVETNSPYKAIYVGTMEYTVFANGKYRFLTRVYDIDRKTWTSSHRVGKPKRPPRPSMMPFKFV